VTFGPGGAGTKNRAVFELQRSGDVTEDGLYGWPQ
jgi:hypothetical protein